MKYPKINTIWKRDETPGKKNRIIEGELSCPEFANIRNWLITEKVDGTNIRVTFTSSNGGRVDFEGRNENSSLSVDLMRFLIAKFPAEKFREVFTKSETDQNTGVTSVTIPGEITLYGEGYGKPIKNDIKYRNDASFILFDVYIDGYWLERANIEDIASKFGIRAVPAIGVMDIEKAIAYLKSKPGSDVVTSIPQTIEGIVARAEPMVLFRKDKNPIMWKLKIKDFK